MSTTEQFRRALILTVGTIEITALRVVFEVEKDLTGKPNKARFDIYNLNETHRQQLETAKSVPVQCDAGYIDGMSVIFLGTLRAGASYRDGPNWVTQLSAGDGAEEIKSSRVNVSIAPGTTTDQVLRQVAEALGVKVGNLKDTFAMIKTDWKAGGNLFPNGTVITGSAAREMTAVCRSLGLDWTIHNGELQIQERGKTLGGEAIFLSKKTGMINTPELDAKGVLRIDCLMQPDVFPGRLLVVESDRVRGQFRIEKTTHKGDAFGGDWTISIEAKRY